MSMTDNVRKAMVEAMKAKDKETKDTLSMLLAALKNKAIDKREDLTEEEEVQVVLREIKQTKESLEMTPADRTELIEEFMCSFTRCAKMNLHIKQLDGTNSHHIIEGAFKALARALRIAVSIDEKFKDEIPSTKGIL